MAVIKFTVAVIATLITAAVSQSPACNNIGDCSHITSVSQCSAEGRATCCTKCSELGGCQDLATDCFSLDANLCYFADTRQSCCLYCAFKQTPALGENCLYGDKSNDCGDAARCNEANYASECCQTCFTGVLPETTTRVPVTTMPTTTADPDACTDSEGTCEIRVSTVPSECYQDAFRQTCCRACENFMQQRADLNINVNLCPYGDRGSWCIGENFNTDLCASESTQFSCCDTCRGVAVPTTTTTTTTTASNNCVDSSEQIINCNLSPRFCYSDISSVFRSFCCASCEAAKNTNLGAECLYGDRADGCSDIIQLGQTCSDDLQAQCCATCQQAVTTPDPCQDTLEACPALVANNGANCYQLENSCCRTCRSFMQLNRPSECKFGDRIPGCTAAQCGILPNQCCATCADVAASTTPTMTSTTECFDTEQNCQLIFQLESRRDRCYSAEVSSICCGTCSIYKVGPPSCPFGDKAPSCSELASIDCSQSDIADLCCKRCAVTATTTQSSVTLPPNCTGDTLGTCEEIVDENLQLCYPEESQLVARGCCQTCYSRRNNLPSSIGCPYGDRTNFCDRFATEDLCASDNQLRSDCCETCYSFVSTTVPTTQPGCQNVYSESTCQVLFTNLESCEDIADKCCAFCTTTIAPPTTTTPAITTPECIDIWGVGTCSDILDREGDDECYGNLIPQFCCNTCTDRRTTSAPSTTGLACPGDAIGNCDQIQGLTSYDICNETVSSFTVACCEYCAESLSTTPEGPTTTLCPDVLDSAVCSVLISTSTADEPCETVSLIVNNCCGTCGRSVTSTTSTTPMVTTPSCPDDNPDINCAALSTVTDVCAENGPLADSCCSFCREGTTVATTTLPSFCRSNVLSEQECTTLYRAQTFCNQFMLENCCLYCATLTNPTTISTTSTAAPCNGDNPLINCEGVYNITLENGEDLCDTATSALASQCCDFCANLPTPATTTTTEDPCQDNDAPGFCPGLVATNQCNTSIYANTSCCASCRDAGITTTMGPTTTNMTATTGVCVDTGVFDCQVLFDNSENDLCGIPAFYDACCAFCSRTTPATSAPVVCRGNQFFTSACEAQIELDNTTCEQDVWISFCCASCGYPIVSSTGAPTTTVATTPITTTAEITSCSSGDIFQTQSCEDQVATDPTTCNQANWLFVCCQTCADQQQTSRKKRAVDIVGQRVKRQSTCAISGVYTWEICEDELRLDNSFCRSTTGTEECCGYCRHIAITPGCDGDTLSPGGCKSIVETEGGDLCSESLISDNCCLACYILQLREELGVTTPVPPMVTSIPSTLPPTTIPFVCEQTWSDATCQTILDRITNICIDEYVTFSATCCNFCDHTTRGVMTETPIIDTTPITTPTTFPATATSPTMPASTVTPTIATITNTLQLVDPFPTCGIANAANEQLCLLNFVNVSPSYCYQQSVQDNCCQSCTDLYYRRKAEGYNMDYCSYGNRIADCSADVDCSDLIRSRQCCDVCYPKEAVEVRPLVSTQSEYTMIMLVSTATCERIEANPTLITTALDFVFADLPGVQSYTNIDANCETNEVRVDMSTPATHTYSELKTRFDSEISSPRIDLSVIRTSGTSAITSRPAFLHKEIADLTCDGNPATNCETSYTVHDCSSSNDVQENCCAFCIMESMKLYDSRTYVAENCIFGDRNDQCSEATNCDTSGALQQCCYTCAPPAAEYTTLPPSTTTTATVTTTTTTASTTTTTIEPETTRTTTVQPECTEDSGERDCASLTADPMNCYFSVVQEPCCASCAALAAARWDLPDTCPWGDQAVFCAGLTEAQCNDQSIVSNTMEICCDRCGPHLTTTSTTPAPTTTTTPESTTICLDIPNNCLDLTTDDRSCYQEGVASQCCASCKSKIIEYLPYDCRYGDRLNCAGLSRDQCGDDANYVEDCCQLCGPEPPTTTTTTTSTTTTPATTTPPCIDNADLRSACGAFNDHACYSPEISTLCCESCEERIRAEAPFNCRFGDHRDCSNIDLNQCEVDPIVAVDCCETCVDRDLPPGICIDRSGDCDQQTEDPSQCYQDLIRGQCCETCAAKASPREDCMWGDRLEVCGSFSVDDCLTSSQVQDFCCNHCLTVGETTTTSAPVSTTPQSVCVDIAGNTCFSIINDNIRKCYEDATKRDCCGSCKLFREQSGNDATCPYGDRQDYCTYLNKEQCELDETIRTNCCVLCAEVPPATTTPAARTTVEHCIDIDSCDADENAMCYNDVYRSRCCETCKEGVNPEAAAGCEYGDRVPDFVCSILSDAQCQQSEARRDCCETCATVPTIITSSTQPATTTTISPTTPTTTPRRVTEGTTPSQTTTAFTGTTEACTNTRADCGSIILAEQCYDNERATGCCATCRQFATALPSCRFGDRNSGICTEDIDCRLSVIREVCCDTCKIFKIPAEIPQTYRLRINITSQECTPALLDRTSNFYQNFRLNLESQLSPILLAIPGSQTAALIELSCGSVIAILELQSFGFYDVAAMQVILEDQLSGGTLGSLGVSTESSRINAVSFEAPSCSNGDISTSCLSDYISRPSGECYSPDVRSFCCATCSSLFYANLAEGNDVQNCPYGDRSRDCSGSVDCSNENTREVNCCDTCSSYVPTTSTTTTTTTIGPTTVSPNSPVSTGSTPLACVDSNAECAETVASERSYCYENADICCASCNNARLSGLPQNCQWGDQQPYCRQINDASCSDSRVNFTCCERCQSVRPVTTPSPPTVCAGNAADQSFCDSTALSLPSICYDEYIYSQCCQTCDDSMVYYLPEGCKWGDRNPAGCDATDICDTEPENCCATCCEDCQPTAQAPTTPIAPTTAAATTVRVTLPSGCTSNVFTNCGEHTNDVKDCYLPAVEEGCCEACAVKVRPDLPVACRYGNRIAGCNLRVISDQTCAAGQSTAEVCCEDCFNRPATASTTTRRPTECAGNTYGNCPTLTIDPTQCYIQSIKDNCCATCANYINPNLPSTCAFGNRQVGCATLEISDDTCAAGTETSRDCCASCFQRVAIGLPDCTGLVSATNCYASHNGIGECYSQDVQLSCCQLCRDKVDFTLPLSCRFGDKTPVCIDLAANADDKDRLCRQQRYQSDCCDTCRDYIGLTTTAAPTTTMTPTTTRLPAVDQCPDGDIAQNCSALTERTGACYDIDIDRKCCRTCYELYEEQAAPNCRYGDKSDYCLTTDEIYVNSEWCQVNGETCCKRCADYLTTTPAPTTTTTVPPACPDGNLATDCNARVMDPFECYSLIVERECCINCLHVKRDDLTEECRYGDAASWCDDIDVATQCELHAVTCCETCAAWLTTAVPATTTSSGMTAPKPLLTIGRDEFSRSAPPGDELLYRIEMRLVSTAGDDHRCPALGDAGFAALEILICRTLQRNMRSLTDCMVDEACRSGDNYTIVYIVVDRSQNYEGVEMDDIPSMIEREVMNYNGVFFESGEPFMSNVNECIETLSQTRNKCDVNADCTDTNGLYECSCRTASYRGDGFTCYQESAPLIGRRSFDRATPPGNQYLYEVKMILTDTNGQSHGCFPNLNNPDSTKFMEQENIICSAMGTVILSLKYCYVEDFNCDASFTSTLYVVVDGGLNYASPDDVTASAIKAQLYSYPGGVSQSQIFVTDVNECSHPIGRLQAACSSAALCTNSLGLYECACPAGTEGVGYISSPCRNITVASTEANVAGGSTGSLKEWHIALIVIAAVIVILALIFAVVFACRRKPAPNHGLLRGGEETPPIRSHGPALYNSIGRNRPSAHSDVGSYFYAPDEQQLPGYAMKTYNSNPDYYQHDDIIFG